MGRKKNDIEDIILDTSTCKNCGSVTREYFAPYLGDAFVCDCCGSSYSKAFDGRWIFMQSDLTKTCLECGTVMNREDYDTFRCPECDSVFSYEGDDWEFFSGIPEEGSYGYLDSRPKQCTGCGSDMYPDCQYSCKLFDN